MTPFERWLAYLAMCLLTEDTPQRALQKSNGLCTSTVSVHPMACTEKGQVQVVEYTGLALDDAGTARRGAMIWLHPDDYDTALNVLGQEVVR